MAALTIGERQFATTRPADLDAVLLASTGCSAAEMAAQITRFATPFVMARAVQPFLGETDAMPVSALAELIEADTSGGVAHQIVALLVPPVPNA